MRHIQCTVEANRDYAEAMMEIGQTFGRPPRIAIEGLEQMIVLHFAGTTCQLAQILVQLHTGIHAPYQHESITDSPFAEMTTHIADWHEQLRNAHLMLKIQEELKWNSRLMYESIKAIPELSGQIDKNDPLDVTIEYEDYNGRTHRKWLPHMLTINNLKRVLTALGYSDQAQERLRCNPQQILKSNNAALLRATRTALV